MSRQAKLNEVRLNKYIADSGIASRRQADELIKQGKVKVNGMVINEPGVKVSEKDCVEVQGQKIKAREKKYVIFNKPPGYITTAKDPNERKTIYDLLPPDMKHLKPAGRLDKDSSGLLILTNDGELILKLTHPRAKVPKVYRVNVEGKINQQDLYAMQKGIEIEEGKIAYAEAAVLDYANSVTTLEIHLYQGYNRQIRRMMEILNHPVISLKRIQHANMVLAGLDKGKFRYLKKKEVLDLFNYLKKVK